MFCFEIRCGDGNMGTYLMNAQAAGDNIFDVLRREAENDIAAYGEPDYEEGDIQGASLVWSEIDGAPALNGGAALIWEARLL